MAAHGQLGEMLVKTGLITQAALEQAEARQASSGQALGRTLCEMGVMSEDQWIGSLAKGFGFKTVQEITGYSFSPDLLKLIPAPFAARHLIFPLKAKDGMLALAVTDPFHSPPLNEVTQQTGLKVIPFLARRADIKAAIEKFYQLGAAPEKAPSASLGRKILVVDDSHSIATIIAAALEKEGYQVVIGHDGMEGLKLTIAERPDLIICDTVMPRMDGYGLLRALKGNPVTAQIPTLLVTAKSGCEDEQRALEAGFIDFIPKPIQPVRLVSRVKRAFEIAASLKRP